MGMIEHTHTINVDELNIFAVSTSKYFVRILLHRINREQHGYSYN